MSGDSPATIENIWECPFCGRPTHRVTVKYETPYMGYESKDYTDIRRCLVLRIECEDIMKEASALYTCPAMSEMGAYHLHIYSNGTCHAYYY